MATDYLNKNGLSYFWSKLKAYFAPKAHTHNAYEVKHSYTTAANAAKNWYRIANANTHQMDTSKPLHVQFLLSAWNPNQPADHYEQWFVDCQVFGRNSGIRIFGSSGAPFSQVRVLYENTVADIDANDRPAIDIYLNYVLATACHVEIQEVYNSGWTFLANGQLAASTVPSGFEGRAVGSQGSGVHQATYASYGTYTTLQRSNITANITLADNDTYRMRVLNCTNVITVTVPSLNSAYSWFIIKNFNAASTNKNVTIHPSTTSVLIDDSNADIVLKPGEWVIIASKAANSYTLISDGRWKSQKADKATTLAGYGITDAKIANGTITLGSSSITPITSHQTLPTLSKTDSGSGNAVTAISVSNHAITVTKGSTFLTSADAKISNGTITIGSNSITPLTSDSNFVHKTGTELIEGIKKFKENYSRVLHTVMQRNVTPASDLYGGYYYLDKDENGLGVMEFSQRSDGGYDFKLCCYDQAQSETAGENIIGPYLYVGRDSNGIEYVNCTQTSDQRGADGDVLTRNWIPKDTRIVHTTGDETIAGNKTFTSDLTLTKNTPHVRLKASDVTRNAVPSADYTDLVLQGLDSADKSTWGLYHQYYRTKENVIRLLCYKGTTTDNTYTSISVGYDGSGNPFTAAPTPATADNSTKIATTAFVKAQGYLTSHQSLSNYVTLNSAQTITGAKTFNNSILTEVTDAGSIEYRLKFSNAEIQVASPSSNKSGFIGILDKNNTYISYMKYGLGNISTYMQFTIVNPRSGGGSKTITLSSSTTAWDYWWFGPLSNATNTINLGQSGAVWKQLYAGTTTISTSDRRLKDCIGGVSDAVLDAWEDVDFAQFKFRDAMQEKGPDKARVHHGMVAQDVRDVFARHGLDASRYSFFCWDSWDAKPAVYKDGVLEQPASEAGDSYALRYEELLCIEAAYMRRENARLKKRVADLEERLAALELKVS